MTNIPHEIIALLSVERDRPLPSDEQLQLQEWVAESPCHEREIRELRKLIEDCELAAVHHRLDVNPAWEKVARRTASVAGWRRRLLIRRWTAVAAVLVPVIFACTSLVYFYRGAPATDPVAEVAAITPGMAKAELVLSNGTTIALKNERRQQIFNGEGELIGIDTSNTLVYQAVGQHPEEWNTLRIPTGGEYQLILSDGTKVWLNSGTELRYPVQFQGKERKVELKGEAYFEVTQNATHPFIVKTAHSGIRVLGTSFNVSCYAEDKVEQTTLVEGAVEVILAGKVCALQPGRQLQLDVEKQAVTIEEVDTRLYSSWKDGTFRFCNMPLEELVVKLRRWYDVNFFFVQEECENIRFTGGIKKDADFQEFMRLIETTTQVKFLIKDKTVTIQKR